MISVTTLVIHHDNTLSSHGDFLLLKVSCPDLLGRHLQRGSGQLTLRSSDMLIVAFFLRSLSTIV